MHLWNEYEGRIIAEQFPLKNLLEPEGRSAFFSTTNGSGADAVIRLIEAHYDEPEILERWNAASRVEQQNLIKLKKFGQTTLDETALLYIVMEPSDASLADILKERALTTQETTQLANSLVPALEALHANNLVHEHVEPAFVLAVGEVIKLRSDCVREVPEGAEGVESKARDVQGLATVLLQALTLRRNLSVGESLPAPFHEIVVNGLSGAWGLPQIASALAPSAPKLQAAPGTTPPVAPAAARTTAAVPVATIAEPRKQVAEPKLSEPQGVEPQDDEPRRITPWTTIAAAVVLALFIGWHFLHKSPAPIPTLATMPSQPASTSPAAANAPAPATSAAASAAPSEAAAPVSDARTQWRVVAYTYNHPEQAQDKVAQILSKHAALRPEVFAPKGHAPYLVTVGGPMSREEAMTFRRRARSEGMPRDTYAQNFPANIR